MLLHAYHPEHLHLSSGSCLNKIIFMFLNSCVSYQIQIVYLIDVCLACFSLTSNLFFYWCAAGGMLIITFKVNTERGMVSLILLKTNGDGIEKSIRLLRDYECQAWLNDECRELMKFHFDWWYWILWDSAKESSDLSRMSLWSKVTRIVPCSLPLPDYH